MYLCVCVCCRPAAALLTPVRWPEAGIETSAEQKAINNQKVCVCVHCVNAWGSCAGQWVLMREPLLPGRTTKKTPTPARRPARWLMAPWRCCWVDGPAGRTACLCC